MKNEQQEQTLSRLINALEINWHNRDYYSSKVQQTEKVTVITEDGTPYETEVTFAVSWDSIKAILELVSKKANIPDDLRLPSKPESN